tara:strand:+ start:306 stop:530 length:225 start_codon:yes stop_codon:yes gene_type:complete
MKYIHFPAFLISFALGLLYVYLSSPSPRVIVVYPTPDNIDMFQYQDAASNCFTFSHDTIDCPYNDNEIKDISIQ